MVQLRSLLLSCFIVFFGAWGVFFSPTLVAEDVIKKPNVAGGFYSADPVELSKQLDYFFSQVDQRDIEEVRYPILIAPHAGYRFSGPVAAYSYAHLKGKSYSTVVVMSPSHYFAFEGVSVWPEGGFQTPLGTVDVDAQMAKQFIDFGDLFSFQPHVFEREHGLETQLPFIQKVLPDAQIVPMIMGRPHPHMIQQTALALGQVIGARDDVLIVISADFSHYHDYDAAVKLDQHSIDAILNFDIERIWKESIERTMEIDAFHAVAAVLLYAQNKGYQPKLFKYANSGDTSGEKSRVVGYAAIVFEDASVSEQNDINHDVIPLTQEQKQRLIDIARDTIWPYVNGEPLPPLTNDDERLMMPEGVFVTVNKHHVLRGCMGRITTDEPLYQTVRRMAISAVSEDPRFPPVSKEELKDIEVEVSVLSIPRVVKDVDEIKMGEHGVILSRGPFNRGVFLPQVAIETGWSRDEFLSQLSSQKAGLAPDAWKDTSTELKIFTAQVFDEKDI